MTIASYNNYKKREVLEAALIFITEDDLAERKLAEDIYRYFGVQPYWIEDIVR
jgi:hypothetical protein